MSKLTIAIVVVVLIVIIALIWVYAVPHNSSETYKKTAPPTPSAIVHIETLKEGSGVAAQSGDVVTVNYIGRLTDGTKFDSSIDRGQPFTFTLGSGQVIEGWDQGIAGMKVGEERQLTIPPSLAYGAQGTSDGSIPPNATLIFDVTMVKIGQ